MEQTKIQQKSFNIWFTNVTCMYSNVRTLGSDSWAGFLPGLSPRTSLIILITDNIYIIWSNTAVLLGLVPLMQEDVYHMKMSKSMLHKASLVPQFLSSFCQKVCNNTLKSMALLWGVLFVFSSNFAYILQCGWQKTAILPQIHQNIRCGSSMTRNSQNNNTARSYYVVQQ